MKREYLEIAERFCGPPNSGNGGYVCGLLAKHLTGTVTVRLKAPPPLKTKLRRTVPRREPATREVPGP